MTLNELKYIIAVAQEKHFRKASEKCFVSQPTLSIAIKKLEEELNVTLFERGKNDILITPIGQIIVKLAEEIIESSQNIKALAKEHQGDFSTELKVGAIYTIGPYLFPKLVSSFHSLAPNIPLIIEDNYTHVLVDKLKRGELDIVILSLPFEDPNIETLPLYQEPFKAIVPKSFSKLNPQSTLSLNSLSNESVLLLGSGHCFRDQVFEAFPNLMHMDQQNNQILKRFEGSSLETIRYMVSSGVGISIFPCSSLSERDENLFEIKSLPIPVPTRIVALAWRKSFPRTKVLELFKQALSNIEIACTIPLNN
ncbi:MAG: LysR family transcriptional regulator, hydrogen peroxide-inducible genes activator [Thiomicrorhabdus sp.]|nr:MAG: LysR family transcriptional regulator, hydrogen peroxide-inducible genes activator [Thiomicrorhabdus sp.]